MSESDTDQEALHRVAELVASAVPLDELFAVVNRGLAQLAGADAAALLRFESDDTITLLAAWNAAGAHVSLGEREPVNTALRRLRDTARPLRCGRLDVPLTGPFLALTRRHGIQTLVAVPIRVDARVWGISVAASQGTAPFPAGTETRMARFTALAARAIGNAERHPD